VGTISPSRTAIRATVAAIVVFGIAAGLFFLLRDDGSDEAATAGDDQDQGERSGTGPAGGTGGTGGTGGQGTLAVDLEPLDGVMVEGFDVTLRFYSPDDELVAEREWSKVAPSGGDVDAYSTYVHREPVPAGPVRLVSYMRISPGGAIPPPQEPGCETTVDVADGDTTRVTLLFDADPDVPGGCASIAAASAEADELLGMPRGLPAPGFVGLTTDEAEAEAASRGWTVRVVAQDGERFMVTEDYNTDRVDLVVEAGKVTAAARG
jgi:hypothetical protein